METKLERILPVKLTIEELRTKSDEMAVSVLELEDLKERKAGAMKDFNKEIKDLGSKIHGLADVVRAGQEFRLVECFERFILETNTVEVYRGDTNARIEVRAMTGDERDRITQGEIFEEAGIPEQPKPS